MTFRHLFSVLLFSILRFQVDCFKKSKCNQNVSFGDKVKNHRGVDIRNELWLIMVIRFKKKINSL